MVSHTQKRDFEDHDDRLTFGYDYDYFGVSYFPPIDRSDRLSACESSTLESSALFSSLSGRVRSDPAHKQVNRRRCVQGVSKVCTDHRRRSLIPYSRRDLGAGESQSPYEGTIEEWWTSPDQWRREVTQEWYATNDCCGWRSEDRAGRGRLFSPLAWQVCHRAF